MYRPGYTLEDRQDVLLPLMRQHSFALLITPGRDGSILPEVTHLPVVAHPRDHGLVLEMHLARPNRQWESTGDGREALVVFSGPHAYISPAWYIHQQTVPTWNYIAIHAAGPTEHLADDELQRHLSDLIRQNETAAGTHWSPHAVPERYLAGLRQGVVGIRLRVTRLEGKVKMGQNRAPEDRLGAADALAATGRPADAAVAHWMRNAAQADIDD